MSRPEGTDDLERDRIGDYLGQRFLSPRGAASEGSGERWRPSPTRIGLLAVVLVGGIAGLSWLGVRLVGEETARSREPEIARPTQPLAGEEMQSLGRVVLVEGAVSLERGGEMRAVGIGDDVLSGDAYSARIDSVLGLELDRGHTLVLVGEGLARVETGSGGSDLVVHLDRGVLAALVSDDRPGLRIAGKNARIDGASVLAVDAAAGRLRRLAVMDGMVTVRATRSGLEQQVSSVSTFDLSSWSFSGTPPRPEALDRLVSLAGLEPIWDGGDPEPLAAHSTGGPGGSASGIRQALASGEVDEALALAGDVAPGCGDPELLLAAGDAYKQAAQWQDAAAMYLAAAEASEGEEAERALLRAASVLTGKLADQDRAAEVLATYFSRFDQGKYRDEALYLSGVVHSKMGMYEAAIQDFTRYLDAFPDGPQSTRVHLALAKLLASQGGDCASALAHVDAVRSRDDGAAVEKQLEKVESLCRSGGPGEDGS